VKDARLLNLFQFEVIIARPGKVSQQGLRMPPRLQRLLHAHYPIEKGSALSQSASFILRENVPENV